MKKKVLTLIDVQEKLVPLMRNKDELIENIVRLLKGAHLLDIPVIWMEQLPEKLGSTHPKIADEVKLNTPISKSTFSCGNSPEYLSEINDLRPEEVVLCGIETHICVYQTAMDLQSSGIKVQVVADCVSSRKKLNHEIAIKQMAKHEIQLTTYEMFLFEEQKIAEGEQFKSLINLVK